MTKHAERAEKLLLVDSSSVAVTLFYALGGNNLLEQEDVDVEQARKFLRDVASETIANIQKRVRMDGFTQVRMALESPSDVPVWRYLVYPDYKHAITQPARPKVASKLQPLLIEEAEKEGITTLYSPAFEADDVIATMVHLIRDRLDSMEIFIWSQDRDLHQLLFHPNIKMLGKGGTVTTKTDAEEYWGADVRAIPLIKALGGDKSDNIPGIRGVGPKTAAKMVMLTPHKKNGMFSLNPDALPENKRLEILMTWPRIERDQLLCTLRTDGKLISGTEYRRANGQEERQ